MVEKPTAGYLEKKGLNIKKFRDVELHFYLHYKRIQTILEFVTDDKYKIE